MANKARLRDRVLVLLRGVNLGGKHPVAMPALRALFAELGCTDIDTYLQSGNLVCAAHPSVTEAAMAGAIAERFGFPVPVVLRTAAEVKACVGENPFAGAAQDVLHVVFLQAPLAEATRKTLEARRLGQEQLAVVGKEVFLYLPHGFGRSKMALACTAPNVAGNPTVRSWKTVLQLRQLL